MQKYKPYKNDSTKTFFTHKENRNLKEQKF